MSNETISDRLTKETMTKQPIWKLAAQLGDVHPIEYGGYFVYVDETGVYALEAELLVSPESDDVDDNGLRWEVRRFTLEPCTYVDGILSDNKFHPQHAAWFAKDLAALASFVSVEVDELVGWFTGDSMVDRARAWRAVGDYHGFDNLDEYPLYLTRAEAEARYSKVDVAGVIA